MGLFSWWGYRMVKKYTVNENEEIYTLARTAWGEARGEGEYGMQAVINVVMNRVKKGGWWGTTVSEVCKKSKQFSCWNKDDPNYKKIQEVTTQNREFATAVWLAEQAITGKLTDITGGATNYHATSVNPYWAKSMTMTAQIGSHVFYV